MTGTAGEGGSTRGIDKRGRRWESPLVNGGDQMGSGVCSSRSHLLNGRDLVESAPQPDPAAGLYSEG